MDRRWLEARLTSGASIESIAREVGRHPSTVAYWVNRHGLASAHAQRHAARGGIARETLEALVEEGLSIQEMAVRLGRGATSVRHWLRKHGLQSVHAAARATGRRSPVILRPCRTHGYCEHVLSRDGSRYRCRRCRIDAVTARRRRVKEVLVAEAGGRCRLCGYDRFVGALQFHHCSPEDKAFGLGDRGLARSLDRARAEAGKCWLVCANCHAEIEGGVATLDFDRSAGMG